MTTGKISVDMHTDVAGAIDIHFLDFIDDIDHPFVVLVDDFPL